MKSTIKFSASLFLFLALLSFRGEDEISKCYLTFKSATNLTAAAPDRLPESAEKFRVVNTEKGEVKVTQIDGYRILYNNGKGAPFVNLKVELSEHGAYESDKQKLLDNLNYLNSRSRGMETKELIELNYNGYKIYGLSRGAIESGSTLGTFIMFPGDGIVIYFYFNNIKPEFRNFESVDDYKKQRNKFIDEYTKYLKTCSGI